MSNTAPRVASETRKMWYINLPLFLSAVAAALSGIYSLFLPVGGFQGGRNPWYGVTALFSRGTWDDIHTWTGALMIAAAAVHIVVHWPWFVRMAKRLLNESRGQCGCMNRYGRFNLAINALTAAAFLLTATSGIALLFMPTGRQAADATLLLSRSTWDLVHAWAGAVMIGAAIVHFAIHWRWVVKVSGNILRAASAGSPSSRSIGGDAASA